MIRSLPRNFATVRFSSSPRQAGSIAARLYSSRPPLRGLARSRGVAIEDVVGWWTEYTASCDESGQQPSYLEFRRMHTRTI